MSALYDHIHAQETGWQSGMQSCSMPELPTHFVQELNVGTVVVSGGGKIS